MADSESTPSPPTAETSVSVDEAGGSTGETVGRYRHEVIATVFRVGPVGRGRDPVGTGEDIPLELQVLAWCRRRDPFEGRWALPSGPMAATETMEECLTRTLAAKVDLTHVAHREQLDTRSDPGRDPFERTIATAYLALVPTDQRPDLPEHADWWPVAELPAMAFDHADMVVAAAQRLRNKLSYTNLGFALAPPTFTMAQLRQIYRAALGREIDATNLQRVLQRRGQLEPTGETVRAGPTGGRPATEYRFTARIARITDPFAVLRPAGP